MPRPRTSALIEADLVKAQGEMVALDAKTEWSDDEVARSSALPGEWDALNEELTEAKKYEKSVEVARSFVASGKAEGGDGSVVRNRGSKGAPEIKRTIEPYENLEMVRSLQVTPTDMISRAQAAVEQAPRHLKDAGRERAMELLDEGGRRSANIARHILMTGSPEYHREFEEYIESFGQYMGPELRRAISLSPDTAGGAMVPFTLDATIVLTNSGIKAGIRGLATVIPIVTDAWNGVTSDGVTAQWLAENTAAADATPSFAQPAIPAYKAFAWVVGSYEALADTGFAGQLGMLIGDAKLRLDGAAFATGTGSGQPTGLVTRALATTASRVALASGTAIVAADVFNISGATSPRHSEESVWFGNKTVYNVLRQFSTITSGGTFWADMGVGRPSQLIGAATYEESSMDNYRTGTTSTLLVLANPKSYYVIDRIGMTMKYNDMIMSTTTNTPMGQAGWAAFWRTGGDLIAPQVSARVFRQFTTTSGWV